MIYFVRHGESQANVDNVFSGPNSNITDNGRLQAKMAGEKLKADGIVIDHIISSTYQRSVETAINIAQAINFDIDKIQYDPRLVEIDCGVLTYQPKRDITERQMLLVDGAEDVYKFQKRVTDVFNDIKNLSGNSLIVSHAGVGRMINATKLGMLPIDFVDIAEYPNATVFELN